MNAVQEILSFTRNPDEDYYGLLGCDRSANDEQIVAEFKARVRGCHPDKQNNADCKDFQALLEAKETLTDPGRRVRYDNWLDSGLAISFKQWLNLKDAVRASMHWAAPKTFGRMIEKDEGARRREDATMNQMKDYIKEEDEESNREGSEVLASNASAKNLAEVATDPEMDSDDIVYTPIGYEELPFRVETPPPEFGWQRNSAEKKQEEEEAKKQIRRAKQQAEERKQKERAAAAEAVVAAGVNPQDRRRAFAQRRDSSVGSMTLIDVVSDQEMRRRFRNYEI